MVGWADSVFILWRLALFIFSGCLFGAGWYESLRDATKQWVADGDAGSLKWDSGWWMLRGVQGLAPARGRRRNACSW